MATVRVSTMREALSKLYDGPTWKDNVLHRWSDNRIIAVYNSCLKYDRFNKKAKEDKRKKQAGESYQQMTIFDYI